MLTTKKNKHIGDLHFEHQLWRSEAKFYKDELKIYQNRLSEVASKNTNVEFRKQVEHFQNQFLIQEKQLNLLNNEIKQHEKFLSTFAAEYPVAIDHQLFSDHKIMREKAETFKKLYDELKREFNHFLTIWM